MAPNQAPVSFEDFVRTHSGRLTRLAWLITRNFADAQDACADALVALYPRWERVPSDPARQLGYVRRTVVNACLAVIRKRRREILVDDLAEALVTRPADESIVDQSLLLACGELPPLQRAAIVLHYYDDLSYAQIASTLGCREATARSHVRRALIALRARLAGEGDG